MRKRQPDLRLRLFLVTTMFAVGCATQTPSLEAQDDPCSAQDFDVVAGASHYFSADDGYLLSESLPVRAASGAALKDTPFVEVELIGDVITEVKGLDTRTSRFYVRERLLTQFEARLRPGNTIGYSIIPADEFFTLPVLSAAVEIDKDDQVSVVLPCPLPDVEREVAGLIPSDGTATGKHQALASDIGRLEAISEPDPYDPSELVDPTVFDQNGEMIALAVGFDRTSEIADRDEILLCLAPSEDLPAIEYCSALGSGGKDAFSLTYRGDPGKPVFLTVRSGNSTRDAYESNPTKPLEIQPERFIEQESSEEVDRAPSKMASIKVDGTSIEIVD